MHYGTLVHHVQQSASCSVELGAGQEMTIQTRHATGCAAALPPATRRCLLGSPQSHSVSNTWPRRTSADLTSIEGRQLLSVSFLPTDRSAAPRLLFACPE